MTSRTRSFIPAAAMLLSAVAGPLTVSPAFAWDTLDRMRIASALGTVLASEKTCGLAYEREAILRLIDSKVPADDMEFPGTLDMYIGSETRSLERMGQTQKDAHCYQIMRSAKAYGLLSEPATTNDPSSF